MTMTVKGEDNFAVFPAHDKPFDLVGKDVGETLQRLNIIRQLPSLFQLDKKQCLRRVVPLIQSALQREDLELHSEAAAAYLQLLTSESVTPKDFVAIFLPSILRYLDLGDLGVFGTWVEVLIELVDVLPQESVNRRIYQLAWDKCQMNADVHQRAAAARLLGRMCGRFDQQGVINEVWPLLQSLSQDVSSVVRATVCQQLHFLAQGLPVDVLRRDLIPCMIELARDEEVNVRAEAVDAMVRLVPLVPVEELWSSVVPLVTSVCDRAKKAMDETTVRLAGNFPSLCEGLSARGVLTAERVESLLGVYNDISTYRKMRNYPVQDADQTRLHVECRRLCAESLPAMIKFGQSDPTWRQLMKTFTDFTLDPSPTVRRTIAQGLHKVTGLLGERTKAVRRALLDLLRDSSEEVLGGAVPHLGVTVDLLCSNGAFQYDQDPARTDLANAILTSVTTLDKSRNWRLVEQLYQQLACAVRFLPSHSVYTNFYPRVMDKLLRARPIPVRHAASSTVLVYLRYNLKATQRKQIRERLQTELLRSESCYKRMLFVTVCGMARTLFSAHYFNTHFLHHLLTLRDDPVVNVRLVLAEQLLNLHVVTDDDERGRKAVNSALAAMLTHESDSDTIAILKITEKDISMRMKEPGREGDRLDLKEDKKKFDEEKRLSATSAYAIAIQQPSEANSTKEISKPWNSGIGPGRPSSSRHHVSRIGRPTHSKDPTPSTSTSHTHPKPRSNRTERVCTCERRAGAAMEISWLNLELALHRELTGLRSNRPFIFSSSFEQDFYRDAGVRPGDVLPGPPSLLERSRMAPVTSLQLARGDSLERSQTPQFLARSGRSKSFVLPSSRLTKAPEPAVKTTRIPISYRRSMDVSHWSVKLEGRSPSDLPANGISRLPVRKGKH